MELEIVRRRTAIEAAALKIGEFLGYLIVLMLGWAIFGLFALGILSGLALLSFRPDLLGMFSGFIRENADYGLIGLLSMSSVGAYFAIVFTNAPRLGAIKGIDY